MSGGNTIDAAVAALSRRVAAGIAAGMVLLAGATAANAQNPADTIRPALRAVMQTYLDQHRVGEGISGISAYVSRGRDVPGLSMAVGTTRRGGDTPVTSDTLVEIGSNTKAFTSARLLQLEAEGVLSMNQTVGDWLPQYPIWRNVTIRRLLNMTSGLPTYSEAPRFMKAQAADRFRHYTPEDLIAYAYPTLRYRLPANRNWFYSNTNYILAGMIVEKAGGAPYAQQLEKHIFKPLRLNNTHYAAWQLPGDVISRMSGGYFENTDCSLYRPNCRQTLLAPLLGKNLQTADTTWAGAAGGIVSTPRDLHRWVRALFGGKVFPARQLREMKQLISQKTGLPISRVTADDPRGFGLGIGKMYMPETGAFWFYEGETLGYRTVFAWYPKTDIMIVVSLNSQPTVDNVGSLIQAMLNVLEPD